MDAGKFISLYIDYLTTVRNVTASLAKPIVFRSLSYSGKVDVSNYLLSAWDDFGISDLCFGVSQILRENSPNDYIDGIEKFKKDISYLHDFLHHSYIDYYQIPKLHFSEEELNDLVFSEDDNDGNLIQKVLSLDPSMVYITDHICSVVPAWRGEIQALVAAAKDGNEYAVTRLFDVYLKSILKQALYFTERYDLSISDVFQDGCLGFYSAIEKYSFSSGYLFGNYYQLWVKQSILRNIDSAYFFSDMPVHVIDKLLPIIDAYKELYPLYEETESEEFQAAIILKCNITEEEYYSRIRLLTPKISLEDTPECCEFIDPVYSDLDEIIITEDLRNRLENVLQTLTVREEQIIRMRNGFDSGTEETLEEIGAKFGVTRERIRQIETKALRKLRHPSRSKFLKDFL